MVTTLIIALLAAWRSDHKANQAIKAGSQVHFDMRVETLMRDQKYSREKLLKQPLGFVMVNELGYAGLVSETWIFPAARPL
jgi:hypothetical protein